RQPDLLIQALSRGTFLTEIVEGHLEEACEGSHPLKRHRTDSALAQDGEIRNRQSCALADLGQGVGATFRRQPGRKQMIEQGRKLVWLLVVRLGPGTFTHVNPPSARALRAPWRARRPKGRSPGRCIVSADTLIQHENKR